MQDLMDIRASVPADLPEIEALYRDAFPDEDLLPLVRDLLVEGPAVSSLVGIIRASVACHVIFTACSVEGSSFKIALLGPLAVASTLQRRGLGSAIVRDGLQRLEKDGVGRVCVLGDPAYYGRLGFAADASIEPPYPLPAEWIGAWQSLGLGNFEAPCRGKLTVPKPWRRPALWAA